MLLQKALQNGKKIKKWKNKKSESFKSKIRITEKTPSCGNTKDGEIALKLKYLSNFWRTLEMHLIKCKINLILTCSGEYISSATAVTKFSIADIKNFQLFQ